MPQPKQQRGQTRGKKKVQSYTDEERAVILATLAANGYNYSRTERETGVARSTLIRWAENPPDTTADATQIATLKTEIQQSYLDKAKRAREVILDRMIKVAGVEDDLFKLSGAFKIVAEATSQEEVDRALANRISNAQAPAAARPETPGSAGSPDPALN